MNRRHDTAPRGALLSLGDTLVRQLIQFTFSVALARLLAPAEFGVLAMLYVFLALASTVAEGGLGAALIHRQKPDHVEESSVFYFNVGAGLLMALALAASGSWIEEFYRQPGLAVITVAMAANIFIVSLGSIHNALLVRELRIAVQLRIGIVASLVSGGTALVLATRGFGVWSLIWQSLIASSVSTLLLWTWHDWRPKRRFDIAAVRRLLDYGGLLMAAGILDSLFGRLHTLLIGRLYGASSLGLYMRAGTTQQLPQMMLASAMQRVTFPLLSANRENKAIFHSSTRTILRSSSLLYAPAVLGIGATAESLVPFLFGERWIPSVPILQVLCIAGAMYPLHQVNLTVLKATGHASLFLKLELAKKSILVTLLLGAAPMGLLAVAWSQVAAGMLAVVINSYYTERLVGYGLRAQLRDFGPFLGVGLTMAGVVWWLGRVLVFDPTTELLLQVGVGMVFYGGTCLGLGLVTIGELRDAVVGMRRQG